MSTMFIDAVKREGFAGSVAGSFDGIAGVLDTCGIESRVITSAFNTLLDVAVVFDMSETDANGERLAKVAEAFVAFVSPVVQDSTNRRTRAEFEAHFETIAALKTVKSTVVVLTDEQKAARKRFNATATRVKTEKAFSPYTG